MNNFVFGSDPLLYGGTMPRQEILTEPDIRRQLDTVMQQYQQMQQAKNDPPQKDYVGDFDKTLKGLDPSVAESLMTNEEFVQLNALVQQDIQNEIMNSIKWKLNGRPETIQRVQRMMDIIENYNRDKAQEDKRNVAEIADYIQNYSDMTFNEYKKLKERK
jgi:predicted HicB family RNase H-like nuclease